MAGKIKDLTGQRFGRLIVLNYNEEKSKEKHRTYWNCRCDCGKEKAIMAQSLVSGKTQSCGCLGLERRQKTTSLDLTGQRFGKLVALYRMPSQECGKNKMKQTVWHCKCDCGNECDVLTANLRKGDTKSCGCLYTEYMESRKQDITNQRFGKLIALEINKELSQKEKHTYWKCLCDCGNRKDVLATKLIQGETTNCGCEKSKGEVQILNILTELKLNFSRQFYFKDLKSFKNGYLYFDFILFDDSNQPFAAIEYNGIQHYKPIPYFGGEETFNLQQENDELKRKYCKEHNLKLIEIPYTELSQLNSDYMKEKIYGTKEIR